MLKAFRKRLAHLKGDERGFTLVELLLVITIVGVLAGVGVTGYRSFQDRAYKAAADAAWRDLQVAINLYEADGNTFPISDDGGTVDKIQEVLTPPPTPLKTDLFVENNGEFPQTQNGHLTGTDDETKTGFVVQKKGENRILCVWVNNQPSNFNGDDCRHPTDTTSTP